MYTYIHTFVIYSNISYKHREQDTLTTHFHTNVQVLQVIYIYRYIYMCVQSADCTTALQCSLEQNWIYIYIHTYIDIDIHTLIYTHAYHIFFMYLVS